MGSGYRLVEKIIHRSLLLLLFWRGVPVFSYSQPPSEKPFEGWIKPKEGFKIEPLLMFQFWGLYAWGEQVYEPSTKRYQPVDARLNVQVRRARFGFRAQPTENLRFTTIAAFDGLGRDAFSGTAGVSNDLSPASMGILDAFMEWRLIPRKESLNLTTGYFRPQFSRESITTAWVLPSIEKSMSQNYIRRHLTGNGLGRTYGVNLGGLLRKKEGCIGLGYNLGIFTPQYTGPGGNSTGISFSPLWVGRLAIDLGNPESDRYKISYDHNFYGQRKGLTLVINGAWQGQTDIFHSSTAWGADLLFNWKHLNLDAERNYLQRKDAQALSVQTRSQTGHIRGSYNLEAGKKVFLEPTFMVMYFDGPMSAKGQTDAARLKASAGREKTFDMGINWHLQPKKLKLMLHYTWRWGEAGSSGQGSQVNLFFSESGIGAIQRGDWVGIGLHAVLP
jgi:hypothetical protein